MKFCCGVNAEVKVLIVVTSDKVTTAAIMARIIANIIVIILKSLFNNISSTYYRERKTNIILRKLNCRLESNAKDLFNIVS
jgi:hypothetical protein